MTTGTLRAIRSNGDLQSKVLLKPGNSGGPLLNSQGALIGVNKGILESNRGENTGISFATSMTVARNFIERYRPGTVSTTIAQRSVQPPVAIAPPPTSGIPSITGSQPLEFPAGIAEVQPVSPVPDIAGSQPLEFPAGIAEVQPAPADIIVQPIPVPTAPDFAQSFPETELVPPTVRPKPSGARLGVIMDTRNLTVQRVQPGSPAAVAGLRQGDRLLAINGNPLRSFNQLQAFLNQLPDGAVLTIRRNARPTNVSIRF
jgi:serine protease Do